MAGFRKLDPITTLDAELRFVAAAEAAFFKGPSPSVQLRWGSLSTFRTIGWQLGSDPEIQVATVVSNHLTSGIMKYFGDSFRYGPAVNLFEKLVVKEGEVACLLAQSYFGMSALLFGFSYAGGEGAELTRPGAFADEEVKAVRVLHAALQNHPQSYSLLHVQCDFLRTKDKHEWALKLAKQAVNCAPSEFVTWAKLTEVNMELGRFSDVSPRTS